MQVKTNDGNYDVASKGLGNTALGIGIAGLATSLLGGGASLFNLGRGNNGMAANPGDSDSRFVTKGETNLMQENSTLNNAAANANIDVLKSQVASLFTNVTISLGSVKNRLVKVACCSCSKTFVCDAPLTLAIA